MDRTFSRTKKYINLHEREFLHFDYHRAEEEYKKELEVPITEPEPGLTQLKFELY